MIGRPVWRSLHMKMVSAVRATRVSSMLVICPAGGSEGESGGGIVVIFGGRRKRKEETGTE